MSLFLLCILLGSKHFSAYFGEENVISSSDRYCNWVYLQSRFPENYQWNYVCSELPRFFRPAPTLPLFPSPTPRWVTAARVIVEKRRFSDRYSSNC